METKTIYLIRHCRASGQVPTAPLTPEGIAQAEGLADFLAPLRVERIVSSPYVRAIQSVEPLASRLGLSVETDPRFGEWVLAGTAASSFDKYLQMIRASFAEPTLVHPGGESGKALTARALAGLADVLAGQATVTAVALHGGILSHLLRHHLPEFGFEDWQSLTNPDVYQLTVSEEDARTVQRIWEPATP